MTRIRANCPDCGDVELTPEQMLVQVAHGEVELVGEGSSYRFVCPDCDSTVSKPADDRIVQLLITGGVPLEVSDTEAPIDASFVGPHHPEHPKDGPALTADDLLDLHLLLQTDDWFAALTQHCA